MRRIKKGKFVRDATGVYHYTPSTPSDLGQAADEAIRTKPKTRPAWFWFNDTPAPIYPNDKPADLLVRWEEWRRAYHSGGKEDFLKCLINLAGG